MFYFKQDFYRKYFFSILKTTNFFKCTQLKEFVNLYGIRTLNASKRLINDGKGFSFTFLTIVRSLNIDLELASTCIGHVIMTPY